MHFLEKTPITAFLTRDLEMEQSEPEVPYNFFRGYIAIWFGMIAWALLSLIGMTSFFWMLFLQMYGFEFSDTAIATGFALGGLVTVWTMLRFSRPLLNQLIRSASPLKNIGYITFRDIVELIFKNMSTFGSDIRYVLRLFRA